MTDQAHVPARPRWFSHLWTGAALLMAAGAAWGMPACSSHSPGNGVGGSSSGGGNSSGGSGGSSSGAGTCTGMDVVVPKRLVRLTFNQMVNAIGTILDSTIQAQLTKDYQIIDAQHRTFPPLSSAREGSVITATVWTQDDQMAQETAQYVHDNFATVTKCSTPTDACAMAWLPTFAQKAFRRPLVGTEAADLMQIYTGDEANGGAVVEAAQYYVYAALSAAQFLYRTEFGTDTADPMAQTKMGPLAPYELASAISFFLTDSPPDAPLLSAAAGNMLGTAAQVRTQAARIVATPAAQSNLEAAMFSYFGIPGIEAVVIDNTVYPNWSDGLRNSMRHETELFLHDRLWTGVVGDLLTANQSRINQNLATLYGVTPFPQAGSTPDSMGFALTTLPNTRSGILTQSGLLVARARPSAPSVVSRGLLVNAAFLCGSNPSLPTDPAVLAMVSSQAADPTLTERQKAAFRADPTHICSGCHPNFDPYGLALGNFDTLGTYTTTDPLGRPIDSSVTLPPTAGGAMVANAVDMSKTLAAGGGFLACLTNNVIEYALAEATLGVSVDACATADVAKAVSAAGGSFTSLLTEVAASQTLAARSPGGM